MGFPQFGFDRADASQAGFDAGWWTIRLDATTASLSSGKGRMTIPKRLRGTAASKGEAMGEVSVPKRITGETKSVGGSTGVLSVPKRMAAQNKSAFMALGVLSVPKTLAATTADASLATGVLSVPKTLAGVAKSQSHVSAMLSVPKTLRGWGTMHTMVSGALASMVWPEDVDGYVRLITSQHVTRPRFVTAVKALTAQVVKVQYCLRELAVAFDLDTAIGVQLDQVGMWVGVGRILRKGLEGVYFSLDEVGVGFDEGVWKGAHDPDTELVSLPDDQYRTLIRARIAANQWDGTIPGAYAIWSTLFPDSVIFIQDWQNMSMTVGIAGLPLNAVLRRLLIDGYIPLKPEGVRVDFYAIGTEPGPLFGLDTASEALAGFDTGQFAQELYPI